MMKLKCVALVCGMALMSAGAFAAVPATAMKTVAERLMTVEAQSAIEKGLADEATASSVKLLFGKKVLNENGSINSTAVRMEMIKAMQSTDPKSAANKASAESLFVKLESRAKTGTTTESGVAKINIDKSAMKQDLIASFPSDSAGLDAAKEAQIAIKSAGHVTGVIPSAEADAGAITMDRHPEVADTGTKLVCEEAAKNLQGKDGAFGPEQATNAVRLINRIGQLLDKGVNQCKAGIQAVKEVLGKGPEVALQLANKCKVFKLPATCTAY